MAKYIIGIIMIGVAIAMVIKTEWFINFSGRIQWAEDKLGGDGTRTFYKLLGIIIIFLSVLVMSGRIFAIFDWIFSKG
ncbi:MAG: hypothetical protein WC752_01195 [Patescibacteria group bacterium]|jgi:hypothetical protein